MSILSDWNSAENELKKAIQDALTQKRPVPKDVAALLKTAALKKALALADAADANDDLAATRKALAGTQKFFMMYGNVLKAAVSAVMTANDDDLLNALQMHAAAIPKIQSAVSTLNDRLVKEAKEAATDDAEKRAANLKEVLKPMKFKTDWKAGKLDFEKATKSKKPSETILLAFRKSTGVENALAALDKACEACKPDDYQKAYAKFVLAKDEYTKTLNAAVTGAKATADPVYKTKCEALRTLLVSIDTRAGKINKGIDDL